MERHVEVASDLWMAKELIAGVHDVVCALLNLLLLVHYTAAVNKKAFVINSRNYI